jgi:hypothetical protein
MASIALQRLSKIDPLNYKIPIYTQVRELRAPLAVHFHPVTGLTARSGHK